MNREKFREIHDLLMEQLDVSRELSDEEILEVIDDLILNQVREEFFSLKEKVDLRQELFCSVRKLDVLQELIEDESVTEIMVNGPDAIFVERAGKLTRWNKVFTSREKLEDVIQQIVGRCNRVVNESSPIVDARLENGARVNAYNNLAKANITYTFGDETVTLDGNTIKDWLQFDEKGQLLQDDGAFRQHVVDYVAQLASDHDTVGTERQFQTTSGRTVYVYGSAYGWKIDQDGEVAQLMQEIQSGTQTTREPVYSMRANAHGINDLGDTYIEVDLTEQYMWYYQNGNIIFQSDIVSGLLSDPDRKTPPGIFTLYSKNSPDVLRGAMTANGTYSYEQPVTYWMPFNGNIGFHDADWQPYFGGDRYLTGGSHGCINLPPENAGQLYSLIQYDVPIVCFY